MADEKAYQLGCSFARRKNNIAFVFPVFIVDDDNRFTVPDIVKCPLDRIEPHILGVIDAGPPSGSRTHDRPSCCSVETRRSTYFASTSTSLFTAVPGGYVPRAVSYSVSCLRR